MLQVRGCALYRATAWDRSAADYHSHRSHGQNGKFRKFKMAGGRHFKNDIFSQYLSLKPSDFNEFGMQM